MDSSDRAVSCPSVGRARPVASLMSKPGRQSGRYRALPEKAADPSGPILRSAQGKGQVGTDLAFRLKLSAAGSLF